MENSIIKLIEQRAQIATKSLFAFAEFVDDLEFLADQNEDIFRTADLKETYDTLWFDLEILNARALYEWENMGSPLDFSSIWSQEYQSEAIILTKQLITFIKTLAQ